LAVDVEDDLHPAPDADVSRGPDAVEVIAFEGSGGGGGEVAGRLSPVLPQLYEPAVLGAVVGVGGDLLRRLNAHSFGHGREGDYEGVAARFAGWLFTTFIVAPGKRLRTGFRMMFVSAFTMPGMAARVWVMKSVSSSFVGKNARTMMSAWPVV